MSARLMNARPIVPPQSLFTPIMKPFYKIRTDKSTGIIIMHIKTYNTIDLYFGYSVQIFVSSKHNIFGRFASQRVGLV